MHHTLDPMVCAHMTQSYVLGVAQYRVCPMLYTLYHTQTHSYLARTRRPTPLNHAPHTEVQPPKLYTIECTSTYNIHYVGCPRS